MEKEQLLHYIKSEISEKFSEIDYLSNVYRTVKSCKENPVSQIQKCKNHFEITINLKNQKTQIPIKLHTPYRDYIESI